MPQRLSADQTSMVVSGKMFIKVTGRYFWADFLLLFVGTLVDMQTAAWHHTAIPVVLGLRKNNIPICLARVCGRDAHLSSMWSLDFFYFILGFPSEEFPAYHSCTLVLCRTYKNSFHFPFSPHGLQDSKLTHSPFRPHLHCGIVQHRYLPASAMLECMT